MCCGSLWVRVEAYVGMGGGSRGAEGDWGGGGGAALTGPRGLSLSRVLVSVACANPGARAAEETVTR